MTVRIWTQGQPWAFESVDEVEIVISGGGLQFNQESGKAIIKDWKGGRKPCGSADSAEPCSKSL